ncbi:MAG: anti-sigma factor [Candidatus Binatia bacterium]
MTCEVYEEIIAAHVDGVLTPTELQEVEHHLGSCPRCPQLFVEQSEFRAAFVAPRLLISVPMETEQRLHAALAAEAGSPVASFSFRPSWRTRFFAFFGQPRVAIGVITATVLVAVIFSRLFPSEPEPGLFPQAVASYQATIDQQQPLDYVVADPQELEMTFNLSGQLDFVTQVADLRPAGYQLRGGSISHTFNQPTAIAVYDKGKDHIVCLRRGGKLPTMSPGIETVYGHYIYTRNGYTIVYSQFRRHYCLLISRLPRDQFLHYLGLAPGA